STASYCVLHSFPTRRSSDLAAMFAGAIGAGVGNISNVGNQGTGGTTITGQARQVFGGPRGIADPTLSINTSWDHVSAPLNSTRRSEEHTSELQSPDQLVCRL